VPPDDPSSEISTASALIVPVSMNHWIKIHALGESFDVDAFVRTCSMSLSSVWRRGEPKVVGGASLYPTSGIAFNLGDGRIVPFPEQEQLAVAFLKAHRDDLKALGQFPGVSHFTLGLQYLRTFQRESFGCCMSASKWLMWHCLDVGCSLSHYVCVERNEGNA